MKTDGAKYDDGKRKWNLIFPLFPVIDDVIKVLEYGAKKYDENNWIKVKNGFVRYINAAFRHLFARCCGEINDKESSLPHMAHAICSLMFAFHFDKRPTKV